MAVLLLVTLLFHLEILIKVVAVEVPEPVVFFPLDGAHQTREVRDRSPAGVGTNVMLVPGPSGNANGSYRFQHSLNSEIEFENEGKLDVGQSITILAWLFRNNTVGTIFLYENRDTSVSGVAFKYNSSKLKAEIRSRDHSQLMELETPFQIPRYSWTHVGMSYDYTTGELKIFVDEQVHTHESPVTEINLATQDSAYAGYNVTGRISQIMVYDVALNEEQVELVRRCLVQFGNANCGINGRGVTITIYGIPDARNWNGNENHWRLNDADNNVCQPTFGHCLVAYGPMDANNCSALTNTSTDFIYTFAIDASVEGSRATQAYDHSYFITCKYGRNGTATSSFEPIHELDDSTTDSSDLKFEMELFYDVRFEFVISRVVYLNERIYVRVRIIDAFQEDLDLLLLKCFSSTDPDGNNGNRTLIENSCHTDVDETVDYNCSIHNGITEYFSFNAYRYAGQSEGDRVWIHCDVFACLADNSASECQTRCDACSGRRRRDISQFEDGTKYRLSAGPYIFVERPTEPGAKDTSEEQKNLPVFSDDAVITIAISCVVAVVVTCVTVFVILRECRRNVAANET